MMDNLEEALGVLFLRQFCHSAKAEMGKHLPWRVADDAPKNEESDILFEAFV